MIVEFVNGEYMPPPEAYLAQGQRVPDNAFCGGNGTYVCYRPNQVIVTVHEIGTPSVDFKFDARAQMKTLFPRRLTKQAANNLFDKLAKKKNFELRPHMQWGCEIKDLAQIME